MWGREGKWDRDNTKLQELHYFNNDPPSEKKMNLDEYTNGSDKK